MNLQYYYGVRPIQAVMFTDFMNRHHVRMLQRGSQSCFGAKPADLVFGGQQPGTHHFDGMQDRSYAGRTQPVRKSAAYRRCFWEFLEGPHAKREGLAGVSMP